MFCCFYVYIKALPAMWHHRDHQLGPPMPASMPHRSEAARVHGTFISRLILTLWLKLKIIVAMYLNFYLNSQKTVFCRPGLFKKYDLAKRYRLSFLKPYVKTTKSHFLIVTVTNCDHISTKHQNGVALKKIGDWCADSLSVDYMEIL